jgi:hypothetical protein
MWRSLRAAPIAMLFADFGYQGLDGDGSPRCAHRLNFGNSFLNIPIRSRGQTY